MKTTNNNSQSAFGVHRGIKSARQKRDRQITIQRNSARQHEAMTYDVEDTVDVRQQRTKGQKNEKNNKSNRFVRRCSIVT